MDASALNRIMELSQQGSPVALHAFGRLFGLGSSERSALFQGNGIPRWAWLTVGLLGGSVAGIYVHRRWPRQSSKLIGG